MGGARGLRRDWEFWERRQERRRNEDWGNGLTQRQERGEFCVTEQPQPRPGDSGASLVTLSGGSV